MMTPEMVTWTCNLLVPARRILTTPFKAHQAFSSTGRQELLPSDHPLKLPEPEIALLFIEQQRMQFSFITGMSFTVCAPMVACPFVSHLHFFPPSSQGTAKSL